MAVLQLDPVTLCVFLARCDAPPVFEESTAQRRSYWLATKMEI